MWSCSCLPPSGWRHASCDGRRGAGWLCPARSARPHRRSWGSVRSLLRGEVGLDIIALLSIGGALFLREYVAAGVIEVMLSAGQALEAFAEARASREMTALLSRVPRMATQYEAGQLATASLGRIVPADPCW